MAKVILITGASSGIGEAVALEWAKQKNMTLILAARDLLRLEKVRVACENLGAKAYVVKMDIADRDSSAESSIENAVLKVESLVSQVDVVFHGAGISQRSAVQETKFEVYKRLIDVNYLGAVYLSLRLLPKMLAQGGGKFVVISSLVGKFGTPLRSGYAASKHALHGFFDSLRAEHPGVIDVMIVCPGFIKTNITFSAVRGDGSSYGAMGDAHSKAMSAEDFALRFMHDFNCGREEVYIGGREKFGVYLKRFFPGLFSKMVSKANVI